MEGHRAHNRQPRQPDPAALDRSRAALDRRLRDLSQPSPTNQASAVTASTLVESPTPTPPPPAQVPQ